MLFKTVVIVVAGNTNPLKIEGVPGSKAQQWEAAFKKGEWVTIKEGGGQTVIINGSQVSLLDIQDQKFNPQQIPGMNGN